MRAEGARDLPAAPERVWEVLADPAALARAIPGLERLEPGRPLALTARWRVAGVEGAFAVEVEATGADPPRAATLRVTARGDRGSLAARVRASLEARGGGTRLAWQAGGEADGPLATVGARVLEAAVARQVRALLDGVEQQLLGTAPAPGGGGLSAGGPATAGGGPPAGEAGQARPRSGTWGPAEEGTAGARTERLVLAGLAGAALALLAVWVRRSRR